MTAGECPERWVAAGRGRRTFLASQLILGGEDIGTVTPAHLPACQVTLERSPVQKIDTTNAAFSVWLWFISHSEPLLRAFDEDLGFRAL